ncbi:MAG: tryptophan synthase subunit alpha [Endomicrobium sp.]|jgi:tryptophan synthase alpha chain|nr:tryptophan synthase subunit alpha [Endomicrobium sp.]
MNRVGNEISKVFDNKKALITYLTAGDPSLESSEEFIVVLAKNGADLIEIGIPFSDPIAEGEVIQNAMKRALSKKINLDDVFNMVVRIRKRTDIPLTFMTYLNPLLTYGYDNFFKKCKETGISAIIAPDMPFEEQDEVKEFADKYDITIITLIAPTSNERIENIAKSSKGFIYLISSLGVTGVRTKIATDIGWLVSKIKKVTDIPVAVGFGIASGWQAKEIVKYADGVIIGSAIVKIIAEYKENAAPKLAEYILSIRKEMEI